MADSPLPWPLPTPGTLLAPGLRVAEPLDGQRVRAAPDATGAAPLLRWVANPLAVSAAAQDEEDAPLLPLRPWGAAEPAAPEPGGWRAWQPPAGRLLAQHLADSGPVPAAQTLRWMDDVLRGLSLLHASGQRHGRLDALAVWLADDGRVRLWGWDGRGAEPLSGADVGADLEAAGWLWCGMLAGSAQGLAPGDAALAVLEGCDHEAVRALLRRALSPDLRLRFGSAGQWREALRQPLEPAPPAAGLADPGALPPRQAALARLLERMRLQADFPALSDTVARIHRVASSDEESIAALTHEILKDVALTQKLLRLVNNVQYARPGRATISTVSRAVSLVGFDTVRNLALSLVLLDHLPDRDQAGRMREEFLRALLAALLAQELCRAVEGGEEAFLAALFQNLGRMLVAFYCPEQAQRMRERLASGTLAGGEEAAALQVLGLGLEDLGVGVARAWSLPESLQRAMRRPLGSPPARPVGDLAERLRWAATAANAMATALLHEAPAEAERHVAEMAVRHARSLALGSADALAAVQRGREALVALVDSLGLPIAPDSRAARLLQRPGQASAAEPHAAAEAGDTGWPLGLPDASPATEAAPAGTVQPAQAVLAAGIQEISQALVEAMPRNDVLRMVLETLYRGLGARSLVLCLRERQGERLVGRLGLGPGSDAVVRALQVPLQAPGDLFAVACRKGVDTLISDATEPRLRERLPAWYRQAIGAPAFLLLPLQWRGQPVALIYADVAQAGGLVLDEATLGLVRTLRNQAILALRQGG